LVRCRGEKTEVAFFGSSSRGTFIPDRGQEPLLASTLCLQRNGYRRQAHLLRAPLPRISVKNLFFHIGAVTQPGAGAVSCGTPLRKGPDHDHRL